MWDELSVPAFALRLAFLSILHLVWLGYSGEVLLGAHAGEVLRCPYMAAKSLISMVLDSDNLMLVVVGWMIEPSGFPSILGNRT